LFLIGGSPYLPNMVSSPYCPKCGGDMRIIAFIEDYKIVGKILDYLGIHEFERKRPPPRIGEDPDGFDEYIRDDFIDCDHIC